MRAIVLGAAAGGGLPQWNCGCLNCGLARAGEIPGASQSSLAVSADGVDWAILNASPDIRTQLAATPALRPRALRDSPVKAVLLTNGDIDHVAGLLGLREKQGLSLHATAEILDVLAGNPVFAALDPALVTRRAQTLDRPFALLPGLTAELFAVPGKVPLYLEGATVATDLEGEQTVGVRLESDAGVAYYVPGCAAVTPALAERLRGAGLVFFDGTLWEDDEMIRAGLGAKTGRRMGHISMNGPEGSIAAFDRLGVRRKVFVHMNNSNPVWRAGPERAAAEAAGWEIARDGMEVTP
jgi:pyrroloquinoline quinone biosynthesis protein B